LRVFIPALFTNQRGESFFLFLEIHFLEIHLTGRRKVYKMMTRIGFSGKESEFWKERGETGKVRLEPWRK
jgi:hypothetical protein